MRRPWTIALVAVCLVGAAPVPPPITITACRLISQRDQHERTTQEIVRISYILQSDTPADMIRFTAVNDRGDGREFTARGLFSHGVLIADRILTPDAAPVVARKLDAGTCRPTYVEFVDGTAWYPGVVAAP